eukprot:scaffold30041_cov107-Isochrysis_galbana.AAC.4
MAVEALLKRPPSPLRIHHPSGRAHPCFTPVISFRNMPLGSCRSRSSRLHAHIYPTHGLANREWVASQWRAR